MTKTILMNILHIFNFGNFFNACFMAILAFFAPIQLMFITFFFCVILDMITGMMAAYKRKEKITSNKMRRTIMKLFVYGGVAMGFYLFQMAIMPMVPIINIVFGLIILTELKSLTENVDSIFKVRTFSRIYNRVNKIFNKIQEEKEKEKDN